MPEAWDKSREKAKELRIEHWGTLEEVTARRYLYAPMEYDGKIFVVKITVKEYENIDLENKLYSIEAFFVDLSI